MADSAARLPASRTELCWLLVGGSTRASPTVPPAVLHAGAPAPSHRPSHRPSHCPSRRPLTALLAAQGAQLTDFLSLCSGSGAAAKSASRWGVCALLLTDKGETSPLYKSLALR